MRPFRESDLENLARLYADPDVLRYIGDGSVQNRADTWREIALFLGHMQLRGYATLAVELRETGQFVGECGPWFPEGWPMLEVGWLIDPRFQGQGIATEAGRAALDWCFRSLGAERVCSLIHPENGPSIRVAQKLGARVDRRLDDLNGAPADVWVHLPAASAV